jgi:glycine/serine hydroxymethyltransferase
MREEEMDEIADIVHRVLTNFDSPTVRDEARERSLTLCRNFPLPYRRSA